MADATALGLSALQQAVAISATASGCSLQATLAGHVSSSEQPQELVSDSLPSSSRTSTSKSHSAPSSSPAQIIASSQPSGGQSHELRQTASVPADGAGLRKTLVRALVAQASILQSAGRLSDAKDLLQQACSIDPAVQQLFLDPLERLIRASSS